MTSPETDGAPRKKGHALIRLGGDAPDEAATAACECGHVVRLLLEDIERMRRRGDAVDDALIDGHKAHLAAVDALEEAT